MWINLNFKEEFSMLNLKYTAIIHNLDIKGYYIEKKTLFIANSDFSVSDASAEDNSLGVSLLTSYKGNNLTLVIAKTENSTPWSFYLYENDAAIAVAKVKKFMATFNIADAVCVEDVKIESVCQFNGGGINVSRT